MSTTLDMNQQQCAYQLMWLLSIVDGEHDESETESIRNFLEKKFDGSFDLAEENQKLAALAVEDVPYHFECVAKRFLELSNEEDRFEFMLFALGLVLSDGELREEENLTFASLAEFWGINLEDFIRDVRMLINSRNA